MNIRNALSRLGLKPWLLVAALAMSGCASGPPFQKIDDIPTGKGLIYIYRPSVMHGAVLVPYVVINDLNAIPLKIGGYYPYFSSPGEITISVIHTAKRSITISVKAGETYYVKAGTIFMAVGVPYIELVPAEVGLPEVSECKRLPDIPGV
jgi:hypothetical protein